MLSVPPGLFVWALLFAPSLATAGPALVFEPLNGTVFYSEDPDFNGSPPRSPS